MVGDFPSGWRLTLLEDCMEAIIDYRGKTPRKTAFGVPLITAKVVKGGRIETPDEFIDPSEYDDWMRRGLPKAGDVLVTTEAPLGEVAQIDNPKVALAQRLIALRGRDGQLDNTFLKFLMQSVFVQAQLKARATGTTVLGIKQSELRRVLLPLPALEEQQAIACILGALDDKIELNRRTNRTLEGLARALFQSWFVDFDPVRAKIAGRTPPGLATHLAALFPDALDDSDLGAIPHGWQVCRWGEIATLEYGKSLRAYSNADGPFRVFGTNGPIGWHSEPLCNGPGIIIGRKGAYRGVHYSPKPFFVIDTAFFLKPKANIDLKWAFYELLKFDINSMDSGSAIPSTSRDDFYAIPVCLPSPEVLRAYGETLQPVYDGRDANEWENGTLAALRDALLPKLISGELRVPDAERIVRRAL